MKIELKHIFVRPFSEHVWFLLQKDINNLTYQ